MIEKQGAGDQDPSAPVTPETEAECGNLIMAKAREGVVQPDGSRVRNLNATDGRHINLTVYNYDNRPKHVDGIEELDLSGTPIVAQAVVSIERGEVEDVKTYRVLAEPSDPLAEHPLIRVLDDSGEAYSTEEYGNYVQSLMAASGVDLELEAMRLDAEAEKNRIETAQSHQLQEDLGLSVPTETEIRELMHRITTASPDPIDDILANPPA